MAYRRPAGRRSALSYRSNPSRHSKAYRSEQTGIRRHQFVSQPTAPAAGTGTVAANEYLVYNIARFRRTFDAGVTDDSPPTATASNNYATSSVFNGSAVKNLNAKIKLQATSSSIASVWDVYEVACSFYDVLIWDTVFTTACPFEFNTTAGAGDNRGSITTKTVSNTLVVTNTIKNFKFLQHYMKNRGSITLTATDGGTPNAEINLQRFPAKCRRSQTGMLYAIILHNDSGKNDAQTLGVDTSLEVNFDETPSDHRLPYID